MKIRNWRDIQPQVGHANAIIYPIFRERKEGVDSDEAQLIGVQNFTVHMLQSGKESDYHQHTTKEQLFYFTKGTGKMNIDDQLFDVREGDAVHVPPSYQASGHQRQRRMARAPDHHYDHRP